MNVKPGDLARVTAPYVIEGRGAIVIVNRIAPKICVLNGIEYISSTDSWVVDGWTRSANGIAYGPQSVISDECLRRIGGIGDNEKDEMVQRLGTPLEYQISQLEAELLKLNAAVSGLEEILTKG